MNRDKEIKVSIVIPTKNGEKFLDKCLAKIFSQKTHKPFEVICIDSGSQDKTLQVCQKYPLRLFQIDKDSFNHGLTRNFGIGMAKGEFVILISQDVIPHDEDWIESLIKDIRKDREIAGVYCRQIPPEDADVLIKRAFSNHLTGRRTRVVSFIQDKTEYENFNPGEKHIFCNFDNVSSCIRRDVWEKIPFAETNFAEDLDWSKKVLEAGYKIVYEPEIVVVHLHKRSIFSEYKRAYLHHQKLYELFQFQPVPTIRKAIVYSFAVTLNDINYVLRKEKTPIKKLVLLFKIPLLSFLKVFGQYRGAKNAKGQLKR